MTKNFLHKPKWTQREFDIFYFNLERLRNAKKLSKNQISEIAKVRNFYRKLKTRPGPDKIENIKQHFNVDDNFLTSPTGVECEINSNFALGVSAEAEVIKSGKSLGGEMDGSDYNNLVGMINQLSRNLENYKESMNHYLDILSKRYNAIESKLITLEKKDHIDYGTVKEPSQTDTVHNGTENNIEKL